MNTNTFYNRLSEKISDLILAVIALGLLVVSVEYVQFLTDHPSTIRDPEFWKRIVLTALVTVFTAYKFVAYSAYFCNPDNGARLAGLSPRRIVVLFLLDLVEVTLVAWLYAILLIGHLTSLGGREATISVELGATMLPFLFLFLALWHLTVLVWYWVARGGYRDMLIHLAFALAYLAMMTLLLATDTVRYKELFDWGAIAFFAGCVALLYWVKGIPDIRNALEKPA
ncbi:hypothetical protein [Thioalkalivibrio sp. ALgr3]|uniref:hypothetical protein n=1 Tax=Thioalkalivibrio sp. ALgr3 TaxID=1239292 RepID=UPI00036DDFED|nr:hypothetical protein [Thioalkalivibrio sp. ALgr3]